MIFFRPYAAASASTEVGTGWLRGPSTPTLFTTDTKIFHDVPAARPSMTNTGSPLEPAGGGSAWAPAAHHLRATRCVCRWWAAMRSWRR